MKGISMKASSIEKLVFGRSGHLSTRTIFGAAAFGGVTQSEADATLDVLLQYGVNHIDTAASYGASEERIGPWMKEHRAHFFLATKTGAREYETARVEIHRSLERLQVDSVDLLQLHNLVDKREWETALGPDGALQAAIEAREEGLVRFIGVTGHGLDVARRHRESLEKFDFDSVLLPWNFPLSRNQTYAREFHELCDLCRQRNVAIQTIKAVTRRPWGDEKRTAATWYQPLDDQDALDTAVAWLLAQPGLFLNTVGDIHVLPRVLDAAARFEEIEAPSDDEMQSLVEAQEMAPLFV
jgi:aryl-alcohol dehydrogenase-like predicted oxidoreductase